MKVIQNEIEQNSNVINDFIDLIENDNGSK